MELGARLAGDHICDLHRISTGVDLYEITLRSYLGESIGEVLPLRKGFSGIRYFIRPDLRRVSRIEGADELELVDGYREKEVPRLGTVVPSPPRDALGRLGSVIFTDESYDSLTKKLDYVDSQVHFH